MVLRVLGVPAFCEWGAGRGGLKSASPETCEEQKNRARNSSAGSVSCKLVNDAGSTQKGTIVGLREHEEAHEEEHEEHQEGRQEEHQEAPIDSSAELHGSMRI